ncbi:MAG TPA: ABC transporter permease [Chitinophagaceae bacterium]|nr:ABC transporter permease [Chitinophagaceae bacterium]
MLQTYFKLAFRNFLRNKVFSFINVSGLAIGLACCMLIAMYIYHEMSYDAHQKYAGRLYQIGTRSVKDGEEIRLGYTVAPMAPVMQQEYPEIESYTRFIDAFQDDKTLLQYSAGSEVRSFYETKGYFADSTFFRLFTYNFKEGDPNTALNEPNSVVLSEEIAKKIFGNESPLNKTLHINSNTNGEFDFKVTGVFVPAATPSHIDARFVMSMKGGAVGEWVNSMTEMVNNGMFFSYLLLKPGADPKKLESKFDDFIKRHAGADLKASGYYKYQYLTPIRNIHLYANERNNVTPPGNLTYLYILMSIAVVTLLIACVNFMNLSTARSAKRALEIGVKKVLGAERRSLIRQFLWEAVLVSLIAFVFALLINYLLLPLFEQVSKQKFSFSNAQYIGLLIGLLLVSLLAGLIAGLYPAFYLSAFKPVKVLKGKFSNSLAAISFRKVLVVFQFVISVALIVASITIANQMRYMRNKDLGFQKENQVIVPLRTVATQQNYNALRNEVLADPAIANAGGSFAYPGIRSINWIMYKQGNQPNDTRSIFINIVDNNYLQTLGIKPVAGRLFSKDFPGDTMNSVVINERAVKDFGFASAEDAIGKSIAATRASEVLFPIVGVVKDFHFEGLASPINAHAFLLNRRSNHNYFIAHFKGGDLKAALSKMGAAWSKLNPNEPFEYSFLDQEFNKNYVAEERLASIIRYFTIVAILISCLGLFGLTTFSVEQRIREIGIRKVLGASVPGIVAMLSKDFLKLVVISFFIASPLAWYFIHQWLQNFAYKAPFTIWVILIGCGLSLLIAFLTISIQSVKVAITSPVKNLRSE